jgi:hypothetical protein
MKYFGKHFWYITIALIIVGVSSLALISGLSGTYTYSSDDATSLKGAVGATAILPTVALPPPITHIATPSEVKAIYISAWTAGSAKQRDRIIALIDNTELNSIVIDVKDSTGYISFDPSDSYLKGFNSYQKRISDVRALTTMLHQKNIYIIGRISVFQDPFMTGKKPEWAITKKSDGAVWKDRKGLSFLDPANENVRKYVVALSKEAYAVGFDEINFDYIRYPSDGNIKDINYRLAKDTTRADNIKTFFEHLNTEVKTPDNIPTSADLFGLVTTDTTSDLGIGQVLENAMPYFDYIAPMVYPSHFASGWNSFKVPAQKPYETINVTMKKSVERAITAGFTANKIRPWLQDFSIKDNGYYVKYTPEMVRAQIKGANDAGISSWMLWDPANKYTASALLPPTAPIENKEENTQQ